MKSQVSIVGYLNRYTKDVVPISATPIFYADGTMYVRELEGRRIIDQHEENELSDTGWLTRFPEPISVPSDEGRILLYEDLSNHTLVEQYLLPNEEKAMRSRLANTYLGMVLDALRKMPGDIITIDKGLDRVARSGSGTETILARIAKALIAHSLGNLPAFNAELAEIEFEMRRIIE